MTTTTRKTLRIGLGLLAVLAFVFAALGLPAIVELVGILSNPNLGLGWGYFMVFSALVAALGIHGFAMVIGIHFLALRCKVTNGNAARPTPALA